MQVPGSLRFIAAASVIGTVIEWYDLFVYGSLVVVLSGAFFPSQNPSVSVLESLGAFVAGAAVRPLGGAVFGRIGDKVGRKRAFVLTVVIMGAGATLTGLLPTYAAVGVLAPVLLVALRMVQGLALGGEFGGATVYLAEHVPSRSRGAWTSVVQTAGTLGLLLSSAVVLAVRVSLGQSAFAQWGWRVPFLLSAVLVAVAVAMRLRLTETPMFTEMVDRGASSRRPLKDALTESGNLRKILVALAVVAGSSVIWHTAQFYSSVFAQSTLKLSLYDSTLVMSVALALGSPFFVVFGWLSDRVGRKKVILVGNLLGLLFYPIYSEMRASSAPPDIFSLVVLTFLQVFVSAMAYGPLGAYLVESFPTRVRQTSLGVAYGVGTGDIGDSTLIVAPFMALALGNVFAGLIWSTAVPVVTVILGLFLMKETKGTDIAAPAG